MNSMLVTSEPVSLLLMFSFVFITVQGQYCSQEEYDRCVKMADPLLRDPNLVFPDNVADIRKMCRVWGEFASCVREYTRRCFTESRREEFDRAVESSMEFARQMCHDDQYQSEYLKHAQCIKSTLTEDSHCGKHYQHLVAQVSGVVARVSLCCSHLRFSSCVLSEATRQCDGGTERGPAYQFASQILGKALGFLQDQCSNYIPSHGECPGLGLPAERSMTTSTRDQQHRPSNTRPFQTSPRWITRGDDQRETAPPETGAGRVPWLPSSASTPGYRSTDTWSRGSTLGNTGGTEHSGPSPWFPSHGDSATSPSHHESSSSASDPTGPMKDNTHWDPSSSNRASGRGMTWTPSPAWGYNTWKSTSSLSTTEPWSPSVSQFVPNTVDEPNQQGLSNTNNPNTGIKHTCSSDIIVVTVALCLASMLLLPL